MKKLLAVILVFLVGMTAAEFGAFAQSDMRTERVRFNAGRSGTTIQDRIRGYESVLYLIDARAGQTMNVSLNPSNGATYFNVYAPGRGPGDEALATGDTTGPMVPDLNRFNGVLPQTGTYTISVYLFRSAARRNERSNYTLDISISAGGTATQLPEVDDDYADGLEGGPDFWEVTGVSAGDELNLRRRPSTGTRILARLPNGTVLRNQGCRMTGGQRWCRVETTDGSRIVGWVAGRYLRESGAAAQLPTRPPQHPVGGTDTVRVRFSAGSSGAVYSGRLSPGGSTRYVLNARDGQFLDVRVGSAAAVVSYQIFNPDGSFLLDQISASKPYRGQLWQSGDHVIEVINRGGRTASYDVTFGIQ
ncbi:MAG: SH3 domain-containing protein [Rhizobiaceae bacterium]